MAIRRPAPLGEAPEPTYGLRRPAPLPEAVTWDNRSDTQKEVDATIERTRAALPTLEGVGRSLIFDDREGANAAYARARAHEARADELDSDVNANLLEAESLGEGLAGLRKLAIQSAPSLVTGIAGGAVGGRLGRGLARGSERRAVRQRLDAAAPAPTTAEGAVRHSDATRAASRRAVDLDPAAQARIAGAGRAGAWAGGTVATTPVMLPGSLDYLEGADRTDTAKLLAANTGAAALGYLPIDRLAGRMFRTPAVQEGVRQSLARTPQRVLTQMGLQAGSEGITEAGQEFMQRAGHKWVDDNVQMLSPEALQEYALAAVGGAALGGALGGSVELGRAAPGAARGAWDATSPARQAVRDYIEKTSARVQAGVDRGFEAYDRSGAREAAGDVGRAAADMFRQARDAASGVASSASAAGQRYWRTHVKRDQDDNADALADEVMGLYDEILNGEDTGRRMPAAVGRAKDPTTRFALSFFDADYLDGRHPDDVAYIGRTLAKLARGRELSAAEARAIAREVDNPASGLSEAAMVVIGKDGGEVGKNWRKMSRPLSTDVGEPEYASQDITRDVSRTSDQEADASEEAFADENRSFGAARNAGEAAQADGFAGESNRSDGDTFDRLLAAETRVRDLEARAKTSVPGSPRRPGMTPDEKREQYQQQREGVREVRAEARAELAAAKTEVEALQAEARAQVLGEPHENPHTGHTANRFVFDEAPGGGTAGRDAFNAAQSDPSYVELQEGYTYKERATGNEVGRRRLLNLAFAIEAQMARKGDALPESGRAREVAAVRLALADAIYSGVGIKPESLKPGDIMLPVNPQKGRTEPVRIATLKKQDVDLLRETARTANKMAKRKASMSHDEFMAELTARMERYGERGERRLKRAKRAARHTRAGVRVARAMRAGENASDAAGAQAKAFDAWMKEQGNTTLQERAENEFQKSLRDEYVSHLRGDFREEWRGYADGNAYDAYRLLAKQEGSPAEAALEAAHKTTDAEAREAAVDKATAAAEQAAQDAVDKDTRQGLAQMRRDAGRDLTRHAGDDVAQGEDTGVGEPDRRLVPRKTPRGSVARGDGRVEYVSSMDPVSDVDYGTAYTKDAARMRRGLIGSGALRMALAKFLTPEFRVAALKRSEAARAAAEVLRDRGNVSGYWQLQWLASTVAYHEARLEAANARTPPQRRTAIEDVRKSAYEREYVKAMQEMRGEYGAPAERRYDAFIAAGQDNADAAAELESMGRARAEAREFGDTSDIDAQILAFVESNPRAATAMRLIKAARMEEQVFHDEADSRASAARDSIKPRDAVPTVKQAEAELEKARKRLEKAEAGKIGAQAKAYSDAATAIEAAVDAEAKKAAATVKQYTLPEIGRAIAAKVLNDQIADGHMSAGMARREIERVEASDDVATAYLDRHESRASVTHTAIDSEAAQTNAAGEGVASTIEASFKENAEAAGLETPHGSVKDMAALLPDLAEMAFGARRASGAQRQAAARAWNDIAAYVDALPESHYLREAYDGALDELATPATVPGQIVVPVRRGGGVEPAGKNARERRAGELRAARAAKKATKKRVVKEDDPLYEQESTGERISAELMARAEKATPAQLRGMIADLERRILGYDGSEGVVDRMRDDRAALIKLATQRMEAASPKGVESATSTEGKHDYVAEKAMIDAWGQQLGIKHTIQEYGRLENRPTAGGLYNQGTIRINDNLHAAERVSVIAHEFGHHVYISQLAMAMKLPLSSVQKMTDAQLLEAMRQHRPEIAAEYDAWMTERGSPSRVPIGQQSPLHRAIGVAKRNPDGNPERPTGFHEWMADNIAKALLGKRETQTTVGKFFKEIADLLKSAYDMIFADGSKLARYRPAKSVEAWINDLFDESARAVRAATGASVDAKGGRAVVKAAVEAAAVRAAGKDMVLWSPPPPPPAGTDVAPTGGDGDNSSGPSLSAMMRFVRNVIPAEERRILDQATNTPAVRRAIEAMIKGSPGEARITTLMNSAAKGTETRIALAYFAHLQGDLKVGPQGLSALIGVDDTLLGVLRMAGQGRLAERVFNDISRGILQKQGEAYSVRKREGAVRGKHQQALNAAMQKWEVASDAIGRVFDGKMRRAMNTGVPALRRIAAALQKPTGAYDQDRGLIPATRNATARYGSRVNAAFAGLSRTQALRAMRFMQRGDTDLAALKPSERKAVRQTRALLDEVFDYMKEAGVEVGRRENFFPVLLDVGQPNFEEKLTRLLSDPDYEAPIREFLTAADASRAASRKSNKPGDASRPKKARVDPKTVEPDPASVEFFAKLRERLEEKLKYSDSDASDTHFENLIAINKAQEQTLRTASVASLEKAIASTEKRLANARSDEAAYTLQSEIRHFRRRVEQLNSATPSAEANTAEAESTAKADPAHAPFEELVKRMVRTASGESGEVGAVDGAPNFRGMNFRSMEFIQRLASEAAASSDAARAARHRKNVEGFARLQAREPHDVVARYLVPMVKNAEYTRRFGRDGAKLEKMLTDAKTQGATDSQINEARDAVLASVGAYGLDQSPTLRALSPALAERFSGEKTKATVHGLQAYQNLRLLPLALISSLVEPMGIAVRAGGDFAAAWDGFRTGVRSLYNDATREELRAALDALGATDDMFAEVAIHQDNTKLTHKVNTWLFKYNGLTAWTRATRYMALTAAHGFMVRHAGLTPAGTNEHSARYLRELGLRDGDVQLTYEVPAGQSGDTLEGAPRVRLMTEAERKAASKAELARDDRVRDALMQFVDEAIIRPNSQQTPMWVSDPYMGLFAQYKAFAYAMYDQIPGRLGHEFGHGNFAGPAAAAMSYIPIIMMAELLREMIQNLGEDDRRDEWGFAEYAWLAVTRTGMVAPRTDAGMNVVEDAQRRNVPGSFMLGPTGQQTRDAYRALTGRRSLGEEAQRALPGAAAHRRWDEAIAGKRSDDTVGAGG